MSGFNRIVKKKGTVIKEDHPCPLCRAKGVDKSGDNLILYKQDDDSVDSYCFPCNKGWNAEQTERILDGEDPDEKDEDLDEDEIREEKPVERKKKKKRHTMADLASMRSIDLDDRCIDKSVTRLYGVKSSCGAKTGKEIKRYYPKTKEGKIIGYKCRKLPKFFKPKDGATPVGEQVSTEFFGQRLFNKGKEIILTCGEEDAMSCYQATQIHGKRTNGYPSVSFPNGCKSMKDDIIANLQWLDGFDKVIFAVDQEELDLEKAKEACTVLPPGKAYIATFEENDASDMLKKGKGKKLFQAIWDAERFKPDGIVWGDKTWTMFKEGKHTIRGLDLPEKFGLKDKHLGMVLGNMDVIGSFEKAGKSTMLKEIVMEIVEKTEDKVGLLMFEEYVEETVNDLLVMTLEKRFDLHKELYDEKEVKKAWDEMFGRNRVILTDSHAFLNLGELLSQLRYLAANGVKYFFIDNLTFLYKMLVKDAQSEVFVTAQIVNSLVLLAKELGVYICLVSHVRKEDGKGKSFTSGRLMRTHDLYGTGDISKNAYNIIAITRNNDVTPNQTQYHIIATRRGQNGEGNLMTFDRDTGRMVVMEEPPAFSEEGVVGHNKKKSKREARQEGFEDNQDDDGEF